MQDRKYGTRHWSNFHDPPHPPSSMPVTSRDVIGMIQLHPFTFLDPYFLMSCRGGVVCRGGVGHVGVGWVIWGWGGVGHAE